jgi:TetR/AcrR family transcriptional regulator
MSLKQKPKGKHQIILEAAQKRFAQYGIEKTTMQDIADDLNMAKGSIYYYFPDKENLYKAVIEAEHSEFLRKIEADLKKITSPQEALKKYVLNRLSYFKKLVNLSRMSFQAASDYKPLITETMNDLREKEKKIVMRILESGSRKKIPGIQNSYDTASLFLDLLRGLRSVVLNEKMLLFIDDDEYKLLTKKALAFTDIFISGVIK